MEAMTSVRVASGEPPNLGQPGMTPRSVVSPRVDEDDESLVAAIGKGSHLNGYVIRADWSTGDWSKLSDAKINIHDVQRSLQHELGCMGAAVFWATSWTANCCGTGCCCGPARPISVDP